MPSQLGDQGLKHVMCNSTRVRTVCWRRLLGVPWTIRRSNQSILKEIGREYSLEGLMLKLKLRYLWPLDMKSLLIRKDPDTGKN